MASVAKKGGGDFVLESRHLVGLFLLLVVIFGVVFTLGYMLGRSQYDSGLRPAVAKSEQANPPRAAKSPDKPENAKPAPSETGADWDFYSSAEPKTTEDHLQAPKKTVVPAQPAAPKSAGGPSQRAAKAAPPLNAPLIPNGAIMVQVAAVQSQSDALALAQALQQKKFPAFVITPGADKYYRVQVGPYVDAQSAAIARRELESQGFKSIIKR